MRTISRLIAPLALFILISGLASDLLAQGVVTISISAPIPPSGSFPAPPIPNPPVDCVTPPAGLVSWWQGEGNADDFTGLNNGVLEGGVSFAPGEVGQTFNFTDTNQAVFVPASPSLDVGTGPGFTLEAWINPTDVTQTHPIFEWNNGGSWGVHFHIAPGQPFNDSPGPGELYANIVDIYGDWHQMSSPGGVVTSNVFQHVALTFDQASGLATIYWNGQIVSQQTFGSLTPLTSYDLYIGRRPLTAGEDESFAGEIDEPTVYERALSSNEIAAIYLAGTAGKCAEPIPPQIVTQPASQSVLEGGAVDFSVISSGTGPQHFQWTFNGKNLTGATNTSLSLTNLHPFQAGNYAVKITSAYGATNSADALLTVITQDLLVYKYTGTETIVTTGEDLTFPYSGLMFFRPDNTNVTYIGWATISGKKTYWVNSNSPALFITIQGNPGQSYTLFGDAGAGYDDNGQAHFNCDSIKGWNSTLAIGTKQTFVFPNTLAGENTHAYPDSVTGHMKLDEATSLFTFAAVNTLAANNGGQTLLDLIQAEVKTLLIQGYRSQ
jgi:hypothetical protein